MQRANCYFDKPFGVFHQLTAKILGPLLLMLLTIPVMSQEKTGVIYGKIVDPDKNALPGVTVTLNGPQMAPLSTVTDETGMYRFPQIPPGSDYVIKAELKGFKSNVQEHIFVTTGSGTEIDLMMEVGILTVEVDAWIVEAVAHNILPIRALGGVYAMEGPAAELAKLAVYVGRWSYDGAYGSGFSWVAGKVRGNATGKMILGGHFLEWRWEELGLLMSAGGFKVLAYNPVKDNYPSNAYCDDGSIVSGTCELAKGVTRFSGRLTIGEREFSFRVTEVFAADSLSFTQKAEISDDGRKWRPFFEGKYTRVERTPEKLP